MVWCGGGFSIGEWVPVAHAPCFAHVRQRRHRWIFFLLPKDPALLHCCVLHLLSSPDSISIFSTFPLVPAGSTSAFLHVDVVGMAHSEMSGERIIPAECLLLGTQMTPHLLLSCIMNCIFVSREIVRSRKDGVARLPRRGVDPLALVGSVLCVAKRR